MEESKESKEPKEAEEQKKPKLDVNITTKIETKIDRDGRVVSERVLTGHF